jgi:hypothetical protein
MRSRAGSGFSVLERRLREQRSWLVLVGLGALLVRLPLLVVHHAAPAGDARGYVTMAHQIADGRYSGMFRTPGYPLFVWLCDLLPGTAADDVAAVQHLIGVALAVGLVAFGWRVLSPAAGVIAGLIAALSTPLLSAEDFVLADHLFAALMLAGTMVLAGAVRRPDERLRALVAVGVLFAAATYVKPVGQGLILAAPLAFGLATLDLRRTARATGVVGLTMVLLLGPWAIRNAISNHDFGLTNQLGVTLFNRAFEVEHLPVPDGDPRSALVRRLVAEAEATPGQRPSSYVLNQLGARYHLNGTQALGVERRLAERAIREHAFTYAKTSVKLVGTQVTDLHDYVKAPDAGGAPGLLRRPGHWLSSLGNHIADWWWTLTAGVLVALVLLLVPGPRRRAALAIAAPPFMVIVVTVLTHGGNFRYAFQAAPEAWLLGSAGLVLVVEAVAARVATARAAAGAGA